uniref:Uncharacterized protein n=1 Tax=Plectus sambesii TaxID=2011161 RepID=A0A914WP09_9BILA
MEEQGTSSESSSTHQTEKEIASNIFNRMSAEHGDADAQFNLGEMYRNGRGVPQSDEEVVKWYKKSAEQGNAAAQFNLGEMYRNGRGVLKQQNKEMKLRSFSWEKCFEMGKACVNQMKILSNGTAKQQNKEKHVRNFTWEKCIDLGEACVNQKKKLSNVTYGSLYRVVSTWKTISSSFEHIPYGTDESWRTANASELAFANVVLVKVLEEQAKLLIKGSDELVLDIFQVI